MIVVDEIGALLLVTQPDHARFAAQLLSLWQRDELRRHPRRDQLIAAVREHDNGWREADAAPRIEAASGRPCDFRSLPEEDRRELWRRAVERYAAEAPYIALLAAQHAWELHRKRLGAARWASFLGEVAARREELLEAADLDAADLHADYRWLELADSISLAVCCRSRSPIVRGGLTARFDRGELEIEPFPLVGATTFEIPCRRIPDRRYLGEADLARALAAARWSRLPVRCRPSAEVRPHER